MRINLLKKTGILLVFFVVFISCGDNDLDINAPTCIEQKIEEKFGIIVTLFDHLDSSENENPFTSVNSLADFTASILENN